MNSEDEEFARIEREINMRQVPDAIHHADTRETLEYVYGWNDCRAAMLEQPAQRTWVGLTNAEVEGYWDWEDFQCGCGRGTLFEMVRDIEAKLKEKNT